MSGVVAPAVQVGFAAVANCYAEFCLWRTLKVRLLCVCGTSISWKRHCQLMALRSQLVKLLLVFLQLRWTLLLYAM